MRPALPLARPRVNRDGLPTPSTIDSVTHRDTLRHISPSANQYRVGNFRHPPGSSEQRRKKSQLAPAQRVAMKMDRRPRRSSVTYRSRDAPSSASPVWIALRAAQRPILIATNYLLFRVQDARSSFEIKCGGIRLQSCPSRLNLDAARSFSTPRG
jgi:hypothetical protein